MGGTNQLSTFPVGGILAVISSWLLEKQSMSDNEIKKNMSNNMNVTGSINCWLTDTQWQKDFVIMP